MVNSGGTDNLLIAAAVVGALCFLAIVVVTLAFVRAKMQASRRAREHQEKVRAELERELPYVAAKIAAQRPLPMLPPLCQPKGYLSPGTREQWNTQYGRTERERAEA